MTTKIQINKTLRGKGRFTWSNIKIQMEASRQMAYDRQVRRYQNRQRQCTQAGELSGLIVTVLSFISLGSRLASRRSSR